MRRIDLATGLVTTPAGSPTQFGHADGSGTAATFYFPAGVAMDAAGTTVIIVRRWGEWGDDGGRGR